MKSPIYFLIILISFGLILVDFCVICVDFTRGKSSTFTQFQCDKNISVCAKSQPSKSFSVQSKVKCVVECQRQQPESCVGVNFREPCNTCEVYNYDVTEYQKNLVGCQYIQKGEVPYSIRDKVCVVHVCDSSPCLNSGTCVERNNSFNCTCLSGLTGSIARFEGTRCEILVTNIINLPARYNYTRVSGVSLSNKSAILIYDKAVSDIMIGLTQNQDDYTNNTMYEILIGGWFNYKSVIRKGMQSPNQGYVSAVTPSILSATSYRPFWLTWAKGVIQVGQGTTIGNNSFLVYNDPTPSGVNFLALTGWGNNGSAYIKVIP